MTMLEYRSGRDCCDAEAAEDDGTHFTMRYHVPDNILIVRVEGMWDRATVDSYYLQLKRFVAPRRAAGQRLLLFVELGTSRLQLSDVAARIAECGRTVFRADDRIVFVVQDPAFCARIEARYDAGYVRAFDNAVEARRWLLRSDLH